jgi:hypothetical protein
MSYILLDESGDLGFNNQKQNTSKSFIVTFIFINQKRPIEKLVRNIHIHLRKKYKIRNSVLHAVREESNTITRMCKGLVEKHVKIMTIFLNKSKVYTKLRDEKHILYNYIVNILLDRILSHKLINLNENIVLIASKRETNKFLNINFQDYLNRQIKNKHAIDIKIEIKSPAEEKCLQAVDIASWCIFRKYEFNDEKYYRFLKSVIVEENTLYK